MQKNIWCLLFIILFTSVNHAQVSYSYYPYSNSIVLSFGTGFTKAETDYPNSDLGLLGRGSMEYFIKSKSIFSVGLHLNGGFYLINGSGIKSGAPKDFKSTLFSLGLGASLNYKLNNKFTPFISVGMQSILIDVNQYSDQNNPKIKLITDKSAINLVSEIGLRYVISDLISINASMGFNFVNADHIDGLNILGTNKDYFTTVNLGLSYAIDLAEQNDKDEDGIKDIDDKCPYQEEDFDGFQDDDGCPEFDNDGDGIIDLNDKCPNEAEDFDGFEDKDGCPEFDNDGDGILDVNDKCPDSKEDFDGFEDADGCPDLDNDNDGILDVNDKCPNEAETFNNFEDTDGCPDTIPAKSVIIEEPKVEEKIQEPKEPKIEGPKNVAKNLVPSEFLIEAKTTFDSSSPKIKSTAYSILNQIAEQIKNNPGLKWRIEGHMDNSGTPFEVKALSTARANAVMEYMVSKGIPANSFEAVGLGDQFPTSSNSTAFGREKNRRVVIKRMR